MSTRSVLARLAQLPSRPLGLGRVRRLLKHLGSPHRALPPAIHVAGTNGKGSVVAFARALLEAQGYHVLAYTSPHLVRFHERIYMGRGALVDDAALAAALEEVYATLARTGVQATFFEATTAAAFLLFARQGGDVLLLETGLGGRLDATNVVRPQLCVLTPIAYDHEGYLGSTLPEIAREKAGILKKGVSVVVGPQRVGAARVIRARARALGVSLLRWGSEWTVQPGADGFVYEDSKGVIHVPRLPLRGAHQVDNAATALVCVRTLFPEISQDTLRRGLTQAVWPGRLQRLEVQGRLVWLDSAHNPAAAQALGKALDGPVCVLWAMMKTRKPAPFLRALSSGSLRVEEIVAVPLPGHLGHGPSVLCAAARTLGIPAESAPSWQEGLDRLLGRANTCPILICGSVYLAGALLATRQQESLQT